jgi:hypothetical protein
MPRTASLSLVGQTVWETAFWPAAEYFTGALKLQLFTVTFICHFALRTNMQIITPVLLQTMHPRS